jgi:hypothetical protein
MMDDKEFKKENKYEYGPIILNSRKVFFLPLHLSLYPNNYN